MATAQKLHVIVASAVESPIFTTPPVQLLRKLFNSLYDLIPCTFQGSTGLLLPAGVDSILTSPDQQWESSTRLLVLYTAGLDPLRRHKFLWDRIQAFQTAGGALLTIGPEIKGDPAATAAASRIPSINSVLDLQQRQQWRSLCHSPYNESPVSMRSVYYPRPLVMQQSAFNQTDVLAVNEITGQPLVWRYHDDSNNSSNWVHSCVYFDIDDAQVGCLAGQTVDAGISVDGADAEKRRQFLADLLCTHFDMRVASDRDLLLSTITSDYWLCFPTPDGEQEFLFRQQQPLSKWLRVLSAEQWKSYSNEWDMVAYFRQLDLYNSPESSVAIGTCLLYKDVAESTQSFMEQQYSPAAIQATSDIVRWPMGMVHLARMQTAGRGRGQNSWLSPERGCLQFSFALPYGPGDQQMVFIQYLMALAIVKATRQLSISHMQQKEFPIFIKWPNDLYGRLPAGELVKLGGILVNSSVCSGIFTLIVGCGFNVDNREPTTSFNALRQAQGLPPVRQEIVLGAVLGEFNRLYRQFCAGQRSFKPFLDDYYRYWLHSEQRVCIGKSVSLAGEPEMTLPGDGGDMAVISGLTDEGYLVAQSISNPSVRYELLPGRNSFNLTDGMISRKNCNAS